MRLFGYAQVSTSEQCLQTRLTLQAKEGRRPRPVVPGSLRVGCFAAGKI